MAKQALKNGSLDSKINRYDPIGAIRTRVKPLIKGNAAGLGPAISSRGGHLIRQVEPLHRRSLLEFLEQFKNGPTIAADHTIHGA